MIGPGNYHDGFNMCAYNVPDLSLEVIIIVNKFVKHMLLLQKNIKFIG